VTRGGVGAEVPRLQVSQARSHIRYASPTEEWGGLELGGILRHAHGGGGLLKGKREGEKNHTHRG